MSQQQEIPDVKTKMAPRPEKVKVPLKLSAVHAPAEMPLHDDSKQMPGAVVVAITNGINHSEIVIHKPVGESPLDSGLWVSTPIHEVPTLLANAVDPSKAKKDDLVRALRLQHAVKSGHYIKTSDGTLKLPPDHMKGEAISSIRNNAKALWEAAKQAARTKYEADCTARGSKPKKDWKFGESEDSYLPQEFKDYEKAFNVEFKTACKDDIAKIIGKPFETLAGPFSDRSQRAVATTREYTPEQMVDAVKRTLTVATNGNGRFDVNYQEAFAAYIEAGNDPAKLKEFIFQYAFPAMRPKAAAPTGT
jgi:hypothetical protein